MTISPMLPINHCSYCKFPLRGSEFSKVAVALGPRVRLLFDYECPRCKFRGRYSCRISQGARTTDAIRVLLQIVSDQDERAAAFIEPESVQPEDR